MESVCRQRSINHRVKTERTRECPGPHRDEAFELGSEAPDRVPLWVGRRNNGATRIAQSSAKGRYEGTSSRDDGGTGLGSMHRCDLALAEWSASPFPACLDGPDTRETTVLQVLVHPDGSNAGPHDLLPPPLGT